MDPEPYPSDLTGARWAVLDPSLPEAEPLGRPRENGPRRVIDAIFHRDRDDRTRRALPHDFPERRSVYDDFIERRAAPRRPRPGSSTAGRSRRPGSAARMATTAASGPMAASVRSSWTRSG